MSLSTLIFRHATCMDKVYMLAASICALFFGAAMPLMMVLFGDMSDSIGGGISKGAEAFSDIKYQSLKMLYLAVAVFITAGFMTAMFSVFAENVSHRIKIMYFKACIEKDASWFDVNNPN